MAAITIGLVLDSPIVREFIILPEASDAVQARCPTEKSKCAQLGQSRASAEDIRFCQRPEAEDAIPHGA